MSSLRIEFHTTFRTAGPHDLDWVLDTDPIGRADKRRNGFLQRGVDDRRCELAVDGETPLGFAIWHRQFFSRPFLALLMVAPTARRRGVGSALVGHVARKLASEDRFFASTNASNEAAQRLFARLGFRRCGTIEEIDPGDPEWIYVLERVPS